MVMRGQSQGLGLQCRDADGEAMQNTCQEVQQHVLSKLGNLTAVCLPDCGPVIPVSLAFHSQPHVFWYLSRMLFGTVAHACAVHQHTPASLLADA